MKVFKNYFKILKDHWFAVGLYTIIFIVVLSFSTKSSKTSEVYDTVKVGIYVKDESNSDISKALYDYLDKTSNIVEIEDDLVEDKLFYQFVSASVVIPKNFEEDKEIIFKSAPKDVYATAVKEGINNFIGQIASYEKAGFSEKEAISYSKKDLEKKTEVSLKNKKTRSIDKNTRFYFNFFTYSILAQIILIVSTITLIYKDKNIYNRNAISPIPRIKQNIEIYLGHVVAGLASWFIYMILYMILIKKGPSTEYVRLIMINSLIFTLTTVAMAIFISRITKSENEMTAIMNIVSLGSSFLSGAFVPQELLGPTALKVGKLLPSYYYVTNNNLLISGGNFSEYKTNILIMFGFTAIFIVISLFLKENLKKII